MSDNSSAQRWGTLLLLGLAALFPGLLIVEYGLFGRPTPNSWSISLVSSPNAALPEPPPIYRRLPADTRTVLTVRPRALLDSPLARKHGLDRMLRDVVWNGFRLGDLDTVVIAFPDQADMERAFLVFEGDLHPTEVRRRLREQYPNARSSTEGSVEVLEWNTEPEEYLGLKLAGDWRIAVVDDRTCLLTLGDPKAIAESLNPKRPAMSRELAAALAERTAEEHVALVMLPTFMKAMRKKMDLNPLFQLYPQLSQETYNPPSDMEASLTGCVRISGWLRATDQVEGELQSLSERQADAEKFRDNLKYSLNVLRKASSVQLEGVPGVGGMLSEIEGFYRGLEVVSEGKKTILRRKKAP